MPAKAFSSRSRTAKRHGASLQTCLTSLAVLLSLVVATGVQAQGPTASSSTVVGDLLNSITASSVSSPTSVVQDPATSVASVVTPTPSPISTDVAQSSDAPSTAVGRIWSTHYTISFPLAPPSSSSISSSPSSDTNPSNQNQVSPRYSISQLPSLQVATVTGIWWSPVIGEGGPGIPVRQMARAWGKYDKIVVAHAVVGSVAWLIISPLAIILARVSKSANVSSSSTFFAAHKWLQTILTFLLTLVAVILGGIATNVDLAGGSHFQSAHQRMGLVLLLLLVLQILFGRWLSKQHSVTPDQGISKASIAHIALGVSLTAIGFAQIYLGFNLYERKSSRKVPVAVKVIWAVIVGLFSIYLIVLAIRSRLPSQQRILKAKRRKAQIYSPRQGVDSSTSWENIMAVSAAAESTSSLGHGSVTPEMEERRDLESNFPSTPTTPTIAHQPRNVQAPDSPKPFGNFRNSSSPDFVAAPAPSIPTRAHFSPYTRTPSDPFASPPALALPVSHVAPVSSSGGMRALPAVSEERADDWSYDSSRAGSPMPFTGNSRGSVSSIKRKAVPAYL